MEYLNAKTVLGLCERFHVLPSAIYTEESDFWYLLELERLGGDDG